MGLTMVMNKDLITGGISVALAALMYYFSLSVRDFSSVRLGAGFVPQLTAVILGLLGIFLLYQGSRAEARVASRKAPKAPSEPKTAFFSFALLFGYIALLSSVGFILTTTAYLFLQMILLSHPSRRSLPLFAAVAVGTSVVAYFLFVGFFRVMIPAGILG